MCQVRCEVFAKLFIKPVQKPLQGTVSQLGELCVSDLPVTGLQAEGLAVGSVLVSEFRAEFWVSPRRRHNGFFTLTQKCFQVPVQWESSSVSCSLCWWLVGFFT